MESAPTTTTVHARRDSLELDVISQLICAIRSLVKTEQRVYNQASRAISVCVLLEQQASTANKLSIDVQHIVKMVQHVLSWA